MLFNYRYSGTSQVFSDAGSAGISFAPDTHRAPTFFVGKLSKKIAFREAISALHDVVVSDLRFKPKDKTEYKEWAAQQESIWLAEFMQGYDAQAADQKIEGLRADLRQIWDQKDKAMGPFNKAKRAYFDYLYQKDRDAWFVLDPVISVHPDEIFFECFSQDESTYGKLSASYNVFKEVNEFECGTTNIDYSAALYNEFQKIRDYKETDFRVDPGGFQVQTSQEELYHEVKIDLPDSWVRGFLQVSSAMTLPAATFDLHPMDVYNFCSWLRRFKETKGPRSIRFILEPGKPIRAVFEPWNREIVCARSLYTGPQAREIRIWGRRRILILERLIPIARKFTVHLTGSGLPSFFIADLGDMQFTLGLSGWTANDWSRAGQFDLMAPRAEVAEPDKFRVYNALQSVWFSTAADLVKATGLSSATVLGALGLFTQAGKVIYDLHAGVYRLRELSREPLPMHLLRFSTPEEADAEQLVAQGKVSYTENQITGVGTQLKGTVTVQRVYHPVMIIDADERMTNAQCDCDFFYQNKLYKGPCKHMLALRKAYAAK
ncbi:SWIM zinc finger family protein [Chitinophaga sp. sic0106]|uniref:SWIM zinc finger family protein n=1 Tax=Chitinophaga sp. sic0106 TaxID=2854785 RepID=UPI001C480D6C|nr:SWIM zinc finger family protein [Chitinophaga sp. sic0106]MBV7531985.1 SWIM zinc finger domain-containing protein [Chitinophaga sp. sic0106]